jgi:2-polyprenyl-6-methoxyphenol hydroxylase-like FAD-dependent oxidoreductase
MVDVAVVGYGPVGQALTAMLGARGHRVAVVERWPELFPLPRAGHVDHEIMRVFQSLGVADRIVEDSYEWTGLDFVAADGEVLRSLAWGYEAGSAWHSDYSLFQPHLESLLHGQATRHASVQTFRGWQLESLEQDRDSCRITMREAASADGGQWIPGDRSRTLSARYVVGCDGANSLVRQATGVPMTDFGFEADWLVVFVEPHDQSAVVGMPDVAQILDPARPTTAFRSSGKRFCRWEFMLMPGETPASMSSPDVAWKLIERWGLTPDNSRMVRNTVFRFRSMVADHFRTGRTFLAGDAAHVMPPFLGQGLCSGMRDATNLSWKLDLVLRGLCADTLLDSYDEERRAHSAAVVRASLAVGELIMVTDPAAAEARNARLRDAEAEPAGPLPSLTGGVLLRDPDGSVAEHAGELAVQPRLRLGPRSGRADDVLGSGWAVFTTGWDATAALSAESRSVLALLGATLVRIEVDDGQWDPTVAVDLTGTFTSWARATAGTTPTVMVRPDFYTFAVLPEPGRLEDAIRQLAARLGLAGSAVDTSPLEGQGASA